MNNSEEKVLSEVKKENAGDTILQVTADAAEAEEDFAATELGKFGSVRALLAAYKSLEAEFTRRSQRLKELEEGNKAHSETDGAPSRESAAKGEAQSAGNIDESVKNAIIGEYLRTVASGKSVPLIVGGVSSAAPKFAPKTVKEAGALAEKFLKD
ncbi:MAG: hypothetical protein K2O89_02085 [Clostridia bacterium]|nr:hypothetical protein [Clostridia bacterium]